jgi:hypothetical protein
LNPTEKNKISRRDGHFSLYIVVLGVSLGMESDEEDLLSTAFSVSLSLCQCHYIHSKFSWWVAKEGELTGFVLSVPLR